MQARASRTGLMVSALGGVATVIAVFLPWYGVGITQAGIDFATGAISRIFPQFAGSALDSQMREAGRVVAGHQVAGVSAHQAFSSTSTIMAIAAGGAALLAIVALARPVPDLVGGPGVLLLLGAVAGAIAVWHMVSVPNPAPGFITVSLKPAAWLGLLGSVAVVVGALWPAPEASAGAEGKTGDASDAWSQLSGWTPSA